MIWFVLAWFLERVHLKVGAFSYGIEFSGIGAIDDVLDGTAKAPMAYRVLVPWLIDLVERICPTLKPHRLSVLYEPLKIALTGCALWAVAYGLGVRSALLIAAMLPATFLFDYWDWTGEMIGVALAFSGMPGWVAAGGMVAAMSRPETALLGSVVYWLETRDAAGALWGAGATLATIVAVRLITGKRELYCERWMWRQNWQDLQAILQNRPVYLGEISISLLVTVLTLVSVVSGKAGASWPVPVALLVAGWTMARAAETRVFSVCLLWISLLFRR